MKKNINFNALLLALGISFAGVTFAPVDEPISTEHIGGETPEQRTERQEKEQKELKAKQEKERSTLANHLDKSGSKNKKVQKSSIDKVNEATGVTLDPTTGNFADQKKSAVDALKAKHAQEKSNLNAQHEAENALANDADMFGPSEEPQVAPEEQPADQATATDISNTELVVRKTDMIVKDLTSSGVLTTAEIKELNQKVTELKLALKDRILARIQAALNDLKALLMKLIMKVNELKGNAKTALTEKINSLRDSVNDAINNIKPKTSEEPRAEEPKTSDESNSEEPKTSEDTATPAEVQEQRLALEDASSIADDLKDFDFISDEEKANLNEKIADVKQALKDRVLSQIRAALDALKALLAELMIKAANAKGKASSVIREKINKLQKDFDEFIKNINSQRPQSEEPRAEEPKTENLSAKEMTQKESALDTLGLTDNPSWEEVRAAYKKEALANHPDKSMNLPEAIRKENEAQFKKVDAAYKYLKTIYGK